MQTTAQEDLIIVAALTRLSYQFDDANPELATQAWHLAVALAGEHGLEPSDAVRQIE